MRKYVLAVVALMAAMTLTGCTPADLEQLQQVIDGFMANGLEGLVRPLVELLLGGISPADIIPWG